MVMSRFPYCEEFTESLDMKKYANYGKCALTAFLGLMGISQVSSVCADDLSPIVAQIQVSEVEGSSGNANNLNRYNHVVVGTPNMSVGGNRADWSILQNGNELYTDDYLAFAFTADGFRTHTFNNSDYGIAAVYYNASGNKNKWWASSVRASDKDEEVPNNTNIFLLPQSSPLEKGMVLTAEQAAAQLKSFFAEGNFTPMDGVLLASPAITQTAGEKASFKYNPDYVITSTKDNANGTFRLEAVTNSGAGASGNYYTMNYVFIPHGTAGTVTGGVNFINADSAYRAATYGGSGYTIDVLGTGQYKLTLDGYTPADGILMVNGTHQGASGDNVFSQSVSEDGKSFIIYSNDMQSGRVYTETSDRQHGAFNFAFIEYGATLEAPEKGFYRPGFDPGGRDVAGANLKLSNSSVPLDFESSADYFWVSSHNNADYYLISNGNGLNAGNAIVTPSQNDYRIIPQSVWNGTASTLYMSTVDQNGKEKDTSISVGYFSNSSDLWENGYLNAAGALTKRTSGYDASVTVLGTGLRNLKIEGVDANTDGILLTIGRDNNNNHLISAAPQEDGSWNLSTFKAIDGAAVDKALDFVYLPYGGGDGGENGGWISGWVDSEDGSTRSSFGYFDMEKIDTGIFELSLGDGLTADDGYLLLGLAGDETGANSQGILSYEATEDGTFLINVFSAMADSTLTDQDFMFAFFTNDGSFQTQVPEPASVTLLILGALGIFALRNRRKAA